MGEKVQRAGDKKSIGDRQLKGVLWVKPLGVETWIWKGNEEEDYRSLARSREFSLS